MTLSFRIASIKDRASARNVEWNERATLALNKHPEFKVDGGEQQAPQRKSSPAALRDRRIIFVDFCPGGVVCGRRDIAWIQQGICTYDHFSSDQQWELFQSIAVGDLLVMKRGLPVTGAMLLQAHGRVFGWDLSDNRDRILLVNWTHEQGQIELPMFERDEMVMGFDHAAIQEAMPAAFWDWLK